MRANNDDLDLKEVRKLLGTDRRPISQQALADEIGCSVYSVSAWEQKRSNPPTPVVRLVKRIVAERTAVAA